MIRRVLVTGSRVYGDPYRVRVELMRWYTPGAVLVVGDARGVDAIAAKKWAELGGTVEVYPADWATHGRAAGPIRNAQMVKSGADICLAFIRNRSRGATNCAALAEAAGIRTIRHLEST